MPGALAAIDVQDLAGDKGGVLQKQDRVDNILNFAHASDWMQLREVLVCFGFMHRRLHDAGSKRKITIAKTGSNTTVVWNPWEAGAAKLPDMDPTEWHEFLAVETVNAAANAVTLARGAQHVMEAYVSVEDVKK